MRVDAGRVRWRLGGGHGSGYPGPMRNTTPLFLLVACAGGSPSTPAPAAAEGAAPPPVVELSPEAVRAEFAASVQAAMKPSVDPCDDFYQYACGGWLDATELPADRSRMTRSFTEIDERNKELLKQILDDAAAGASTEPAWQKVGTYYRTCLDEAAIDAAGVAPVKPWLDVAASVTDLRSLATATGRLQAQGVDVLFGGAVWADLKNPDVNILNVGQGGLGLPDRDYYLDESAEKVELRSSYLAHIGRSLSLAGFAADAADHMAHDVLAFETRLAEIAFPRDQLRDPTAIYHKVDRAGLQALMPSFPLDAFFEAAGAPGVVDINVEKTEYFAALEKVLTSTDAEVFRSYLTYRALALAASDLDTAMVDEHFAFYGRTLNGQKENEARWKRCAEQVDVHLGDLLGQAYVDRAFAGDSKAIALDMIQRVEASFEAGLTDLAWMDDSTRGRAKEKARAITNKIGYPDAWKSYDDLTLVDGRHFENAAAARGRSIREQMDKIGKPVDPAEWFMTASTVNAYYNPTENEIVFPAGIMQPPMFHRSFPAAANFGAMGLVMGHEISHGFDDSGRQFTADGRLEDWWEATAAEGFEAKAECVVDAYSAFEALPGLKVNGELTLGENIADIGGARFAFRAYRDWVAANGAEPPVAELSGEKLFFVSFAQVWCSESSAEATERMVRTDPHSPGEFRVNGTLQHTPEFHEVFECPVGSGMHPSDDVCVVW